MALWLQPQHQALSDRFVVACQADARVVAAFLGGSYARGAADAYSDLDLYLITTDAAFEEFVATRVRFMQSLGELAFVEDFGHPHALFYIFADGVEGELGLGCEREFTHIHRGPYTVLVDKIGLLAEAVFIGQVPSQTEQIEALRRQIYWFWHDLSHFITALGRGQLWWAYGEIEILRRCVVNLVRLRQNFAEAEVGDESYFKVEQAIASEHLASLQASVGVLERSVLLHSARLIVRFFQTLAPPLAQAHGIPYPTDLDQLMVTRLETLGVEDPTRPL